MSAANPTPVADSGNVWLDGLIWGERWANTGTSTTTIFYYIAGAQEIDFGGELVSTTNMLTQEQAAVQAAMTLYSQIANITFVQTTNITQADLVSGACFDTEPVVAGSYGIAVPPGEYYNGADWQSAVLINIDAYEGAAATGAMQAGGYDFVTVVHELGHALGLAHPHDTGGGSTIFPGVTAAFGDYGDFNVNQGIYTLMSYNDGRAAAGQTIASTSAEWGWTSGPMALDIAAIQYMYGANTSYNSGANTYTLPTTNAVGSALTAIWDGGGADTIQHTGSANSTIDLRPASLLLDASAGGYLSAVNGIWGGFTIAYNVVIENATGGTGADTLIGNDAANSLIGNAGSDNLSGGLGNDFLNGGADNDVLDGGIGLDYTNYLGASSAVTVNLGVAGAQAIGGGQGSDTLISIEGVYGSNFADTITGQNTADTNAIYGWGGNDTITGRAGFDYIEGGDGNDSINPGGDNDYVIAGNGIDTLDYSDATAAVYVDMSGAAAFANGTSIGFDVLSSIEIVKGSGLADFLFGSTSADTIEGGAGSDVIYGFGLGDSLNGGSETDYIVGGAGADTITTGTGQDYVYFQGQAEGKDTITDWRASGFDLLVIDEPSFGGGMTAGLFLSQGANIGRFVNGTAATAAFGQFIWNSATSTLSWDADGTGGGAAVQIVTLTGVTNLAASDILVL